MQVPGAGAGACMGYFLPSEPNYAMEQHALKNVNNSLNINICSYLETSGGQCSNPY